MLTLPMCMPQAVVARLDVAQDPPRLLKRRLWLTAGNRPTGLLMADLDDRRRDPVMAGALDHTVTVIFGASRVQN
jgi:hypothetical protein